MLRVQKITTLSELRNYAQELEDYESRLTINSLFVSYRWVESWIRAYLKHFHLSIFIVWQDQIIIALLPLVDMDPHKLHLSPRRLELVSLSSQGDLVNLPCIGNPLKIAESLLDFLDKDENYWDFIYLESLHENDELAHGLSTSTLNLGYKGKYGQLIESQRNWYIPIESSWDEYFSTLGSRLRKLLKRKLKKCERDGGQTVNFITSLDHNDELWEKMLEIDRNSWQYENGIGLSSHKNHTFYLNLARQYSNRGLHIWILEIGGRPAAFEFSIAYRNKVYGLRWGYHKEYKSYSPGQLLRCVSLKYYFDKKFTEFDLLGKFDDAKKLWTNHSRHQYELLIFNKTLWGKYLNFKYNQKIHGLRRYIKSKFH